jgi:protein gp37
MADHTKIEWADATVNFWAGCTKVSPACDNCYAEKMAGRLWGLKWGPGERRQHFLGAVETLAKLDRKAQKLGTRLSVFINSLSDLFDNAVDDADRMDAFEAMAMFRNLVFLVLTKRIGNVAPYLQRDSLAFDLIGEGRVWLGITVCNQPEADRDIPKMQAVPAAKRFLSMEPLLGPVDLDRISVEGREPVYPLIGNSGWTGDDGRPVPGVDAIDWVIVGGESGPGARPMHPDWARSLRDQCQSAGVPFLFKQWGQFAPIAWFDGPDSENDSGEDFFDLDRIDHVFLARDGRTWETCGGRYMYPPLPLGHWCLMGSIGKKAAGRLLDSVEHNGRPA